MEKEGACTAVRTGGVKSSQTGDERLKDQVFRSGIRVGRALSRPEERGDRRSFVCGS